MAKVPGGRGIQFQGNIGNTHYGHILIWSLMGMSKVEAPRLVLPLQVGSGSPIWGFCSASHWVSGV